MVKRWGKVVDWVISRSLERCLTPKRCCSSMTTRPRFFVSSFLNKSAWVPMYMSVLELRFFLVDPVTRFSLRADLLKTVFRVFWVISDFVPRWNDILYRPNDCHYNKWFFKFWKMSIDYFCLCPKSIRFFIIPEVILYFKDKWGLGIQLFFLRTFPRLSHT